MPGQPDAEHGLPQPAGDLYVDQAQRNRQTRPRGQHLIQATVRRVVVVAGVASKAQLAEQVTVGERDKRRTRRALDARRQVRGQRIQDGQIRLDIDLGVLDGGEVEGRLVEWGVWGDFGRRWEEFGEGKDRPLDGGKEPIP
jgi:hypothetical protein